jgi:hypothetical protein
MAAHMRNAGEQPGVSRNQIYDWLHFQSTASDWQAQALSSRFCLSPWMARDIARLCFGKGGCND